MRNRMYGGVRGRKTKVGGKPTFVFLLLDYMTTVSDGRISLAWFVGTSSDSIPLLDLHRDSNMGLRCSFIVPLALAWDV